MGKSHPSIPGIPSLPGIPAGNFTDNYNRSDGGVGANYEDIEGAATISSNKVVYSGTARVIAGSGVGADYWSQAVITPSLGAAGVLCRDDSVPAGSQTYYLAYLSATEIKLFKRVSGTFTLLGSVGSVNTSATVKCDVVGTTIRALVDGVEKVSVTDSAISTAAYPGIYVYDNGGESLDNFETNGRRV